MSKKKIIILCAILSTIACSCLIFFVLTKEKLLTTNINEDIINNTSNSSTDNDIDSTVNEEFVNTTISTEENTSVLEESTEQQPTEQIENNNNQNTNTNTKPSTNTNNNTSSKPTESKDTTSQDSQDSASNEEQKPVVPSISEVIITYYGDANEDGKLDIADSSTVKRHIEGSNVLTGQALKNADINADGKVNNVDAVLIQGALAKIYSHEITKPLTNYILYGDANEDGVLDIADSSTIKRHIEGSNVLTGQALKNADINADGKVDNVDAVLLQGALAKIYSHEITKPLTNYILYGDANEDGKIDIADSSTIKRHLEGSNTLTGQALKNADINADGKVNNVDAVLLQGALAKIYSHQITKPLTNYVLYGDANEDGKIDIADVSKIKMHIEGSKTLTGQALKNSDVNNDGNVDKTDATLVQEFLASMHPNTLPNKPII